MYLFPLCRKEKYPFLQDNKPWWPLLVLDLFAIPGVIILGKLVLQRYEDNG